MRPLVKGLIVAVIHVCFVASLGAKLLYDRATLPRVWANTVPYDPNLPIRGRYVSLQLTVGPRNIPESTQPGRKWYPPHAATLHVEGGRLIAEGKPQGDPYRPSDLHVRIIERGDKKLSVLEEPVAFFIPEHVLDPSRRPSGEQLWVEVTVPKKGVPRPIRLGVKRENGPIVRLNLN